MVKFTGLLFGHVTNCKILCVKLTRLRNIDNIVGSSEAIFYYEVRDGQVLCREDVDGSTFPENNIANEDV